MGGRWWGDGWRGWVMGMDSGEVGNSQGPLAANDMNLGIKLLPNNSYTILLVILYKF